MNNEEKIKLVELIKQNGVYNGSSMGEEYYVVKPECLAEIILENKICKPSQTAKQRVETEYVELNEKITKLNNFITSNNFKLLSVIQQILLIQQFEDMSSYAKCLKLRLECWGDV